MNDFEARGAARVARYRERAARARALAQARFNSPSVEAEESTKITSADPGYRTTYVYGNALVNGPRDGQNLLHYGGTFGTVTSARSRSVASLLISWHGSPADTTGTWATRGR